MLDRNYMGLCIAGSCVISNYLLSCTVKMEDSRGIVRLGMPRKFIKFIQCSV